MINIQPQTYCTCTLAYFLSRPTAQLVHDCSQPESKQQQQQSHLILATMQIILGDQTSSEDGELAPRSTVSSTLNWWWWWLSTCTAHYAEHLYCATCPGVLWKGMSSVLIEKIPCWAMDHGDDQAAGSRPSDLPRRMPDVRTYCDDDVVRSADGCSVQFKFICGWQN